MTRLTFRRGDAVVIAAILAAAIALTAAFVLSARRGAAASVEIRQNGEVLAVLPLDEDAEFTVGGAYTNVIEVRGGEVFFAESDCPGRTVSTAEQSPRPDARWCVCRTASKSASRRMFRMKTPSTASRAERGRRHENQNA